GTKNVCARADRSPDQRTALLANRRNGPFRNTFEHTTIAGHEPGQQETHMALHTEDNPLTAEQRPTLVTESTGRPEIEVLDRNDGDTPGTHMRVQKRDGSLE